MIQRGALVKELNRVSAENKKLREMLSAIYENYSELRNQLVDYTNKNPSSRKRSLNGLDATRPSQSSSSEEDSRKKTREEEPIKAKILEVRVRIEASDASHVSRTNSWLTFRSFGCYKSYITSYIEIEMLSTINMHTANIILILS